MPRDRTSFRAHLQAAVHVRNKNEGSRWPPEQELPVWYG